MAVKLAAALDVSVGYLLGVEERPAHDSDVLRRIRALERLDPKTRTTVLEVVDTFIRDATARKAYLVSA